MHSPDAVVYDLDGTLVRLDVDWRTVREDVASALDHHDLDTRNESLWDLLELADRTGYRGVAEAVITDHERAGARTSERLPPADDLLSTDVPVGVCSLNCEAACRIALETHDLADSVAVIVGRDTVVTEKPDPAPLLRAVEALHTTPDRALFIGDTERDHETARRAGVRFRHVDDLTHS